MTDTYPPARAAFEAMMKELRDEKATLRALHVATAGDSAVAPFVPAEDQLAASRRHDVMKAIEVVERNAEPLRDLLRLYAAIRRAYVVG